VQLWDPHQWRLLADLISPDPQIIHWLAFSPDARRLAVATLRDRVELWDLSVLRAELGKLALDWAEACGDPAIGPAIAAAASVRGTAVVLVTVLAGVGLVIFCAGFVLRRQRELISAYLQVDRQMEQRTRELELAQAEILHGQKMKALGTLAAGIAHDFNNLLSIIRMANKLSGQESPANPEVQDNVRLVEKAVGQGKQLVNSMLGYSRDSGVAQGPFQVAEVVESATGLLSKQFLGGIALKLDLDRQLPLVEASRSRLEQILLNLIVNASEAMKGGGELRVRVSDGCEPNGTWTLPPAKAARYIQLTVADSGPGIPVEILPRIFEPFFTTKHVGATRGTGLGLSMVYTLAQHEGMGIRVESEPGRGTSFFIAIPAGQRT
jgi:signal transduction histidine kinase